jgi:hypothetical protein
LKLEPGKPGRVRKNGNTGGRSARRKVKIINEKRKMEAMHFLRFKNAFGEKKRNVTLSFFFVFHSRC